MDLTFDAVDYAHGISYAAAHLALQTASKADGGCLDCVTTCVRHAVALAPDLPWEVAARFERDESMREILLSAIVLARAELLGAVDV
jgi:hypothetical protein